MYRNTSTTITFLKVSQVVGYLIFFKNKLTNKLIVNIFFKNATKLFKTYFSLYSQRVNELPV